MGSMEAPRAENGRLTAHTANGCHQNGGSTGGGGGAQKGGRPVALPLEVGTRVMCRWRDDKLHPVKVIERRKVSSSAGSGEYEYYVHYTECEY